MMKKIAILLALAFAACIPNNLPSDPTGGSAGSIAGLTQDLDTVYHAVNSNNGARFMMSNNDNVVQSAVRLHAMGSPSCTYSCEIGVGNGHQTFCKASSTACVNYYSNPQNPNLPYLIGMYSTYGADINHTNPAIFIGNTDDSGNVSGHRFHHVYSPQTGVCGGTADGDVLNPNMLPNNNYWTIHCP